uniref:Uncharacterized protein n=1 Tax=Arundo donax TaxID=35708 RepID=A0A0A9F1T7_ARUDO
MDEVMSSFWRPL